MTPITITDKHIKATGESFGRPTAEWLALVCNKANEIALAEANAQQETYISIGEAMKLGAGNFEVLCEDGKWRTGTQDCPYRETWGGRVIKYRAIQPQPQPEPVEPTCQVQHINGFTSGEVITMTRRAAQKLQAETKDVCDWFYPNNSEPWQGLTFIFDKTGIYTYRTKPAKVVAWTGSREDVIALLKENGLL